MHAGGRSLFRNHIRSHIRHHIGLRPRIDIPPLAPPLGVRAGLKAEGGLPA